MKRYENMSKEKIVDFIRGCPDRDCAGCPAYIPSAGFSVILDCINRYMNEEIHMVPRWQTAKTQEDMKKLFLDFRDRCITRPCATCRFEKEKSNEKDFVAAGSACFLAYLLEQVEVPEVET